MNKNSTLVGKYLIMLTALAVFSLSAKSQTISPKLKFFSPKLVAGTNGAKYAVYKFADVVPGVDAFVKIEDIKNGATLVNIDDSTFGYYDAWQPIVGGPGTDGTSYIKWAVEFKTSSGTEYTFPLIDVCAIDIDGDNVRVREFIDVNGQSGYDLPTVIPTLLSVSNQNNDSNGEGTDDSNTNLHILGPVNNRTNIDTTALDVRIGLHFINKSKIKFYIGSQVDNNGTGGGISTDRYSSLYFKKIGNSIGTLPVTYHSFDVIANNQSVNLSWVTDVETRNDHFEIQRSFDQSDFKTIGLASDAQATTGMSKQYSFKDGMKEIRDHAVIYYRLKQINIDGSFTYSVVKMVRFIASKSFIQISPNPYLDKLNVNFVSDESGSAEYRLTNASGNVVKRIQSTITKGYNNVQLENLNYQSPGLYIVSIVINGKVIASQKVLKQ